MNNSPKKFVRRYLLQYAAISLAFIALCAVYFILFDESVLSVLIFFVICLLCYRLIIRFSAKKLFSPLYDECDAQKYYDIIYLMPPPLYSLFKMDAEEYMGNYDKMIAMASAHYDASKKLKDKCIALIYLADAYFWLRDRENLAKTIEKFNRLKKDNPKKCKIFTSYKVFDYFQDYLDGEFGRCIATSEENLKKLDKHPKQRRISKTRITFNIAVMCYESGNMERARELFTNIIETTPKLVNFKKLSEKYLSAIETGNSDILAPVILDIDTTLYSQERKAIQKRKCWMILWDAIILVLAGFML